VSAHGGVNGVRRQTGLVTTLGDLLHPEQARGRRERENLKKVMRRLREQQRHLEAEHAATDDPAKRERLDTAIRIARAQRAKGIGILRRG
jgi:hypothetical protein